MVSCLYPERIKKELKDLNGHRPIAQDIMDTSRPPCARAQAHWVLQGQLQRSVPRRGVLQVDGNIEHMPAASSDLGQASIRGYILSFFLFVGELHCVHFHIIKSSLLMRRSHAPRPILISQIWQGPYYQLRVKALDCRYLCRAWRKNWARLV